jgi:hypothetical protein
MRKRLLSHLPKLFLSVSLCGVALGAHAQEAPQVPAATKVIPSDATAPKTPVTYQVTPAPETRYSPGQTQQAYSETTWKRPNRPLLTTSALTFTAAYLPTLITAAVNDDDSSDNLFIPLAGPWMEIARNDTSGGNKALLVFSGIFQDLGALGMISSFFVPETKTERWYLMGNKRFSAAPVATRDTYGLTARGTF